MPLTLGNKIATLGSGWIRWKTADQYNNPIKKGWIYAQTSNDGEVHTLAYVTDSAPSRNTLHLTNTFVIAPPTL